MKVASDHLTMTILNLLATGHSPLSAASHALRSAAALLLALRHNCGTKSAAEVFRKFVELRIAIDLDGLLGCVAHHVAVVAPRKMIFQLGFGFLVEDAVQVTGQLAQEFRAFHRSPSPLSTSLLLTSSPLVPPFLPSPLLPFPDSRRWK